MTTPREYDVTLVERLSVIATEAESRVIAGVLVHLATARGIVVEPPVLAIEPDWTDRAGLLDEWRSDHPDDDGEPAAEVVLPPGVGLWVISLSFRARGTEEQIDDLGMRRLAEVVSATIRRVVDAGLVERRSPADGVHHVSFIDIPYDEFD